MKGLKITLLFLPVIQQDFSRAISLLLHVLWAARGFRWLLAVGLLPGSGPQAAQRAAPLVAGLAGFNSCGTQAEAPLPVGSLWTGDQTRVPSTGRQTPDHWITREVLREPLLIRPQKSLMLRKIEDRRRRGRQRRRWLGGITAQWT